MDKTIKLDAWIQFAAAAAKGFTSQIEPSDLDDDTLNDIVSASADVAHALVDELDDAFKTSPKRRRRARSEEPEEEEAEE